MKKNGMLKIVSILCAAVLIAAAALALTQVFGGAVFTYANAEKYTAGNAEILDTVKNLDVEWTSGKVIVAYHKGNAVTLSETANQAIGEDMKLRWWLDGDTLRVRYSKAGLHLHWNLQKELIITLPEGIAFENARITATSGALSIPALEAENLALSTTSGSIAAQAAARKANVSSTSGNIDIQLPEKTEELHVNATSGRIALEAEEAGQVIIGATSGDIRAAVRSADSFKASSTSGSVNTIVGEGKNVKITSTSGAVTLKIARLENLEVETTSGSIAATLPTQPGFTARLSSVSGRIQHDLPLAKQGSDYICGDGSGKVRLSTTSGGITILPAEK